MTVEKCTKKRDALAKLLFCLSKPIAFLPFLLPSPSSLRKLPNKELKQRQRRRNENGKKAIGLDKQNNNFARASRFFVHFSTVIARLQSETAKFHVLSRTGKIDNNLLFRFLNFDTYSALEFNSKKGLPKFDEVNGMK